MSKQLIRLENEKKYEFVLMDNEKKEEHNDGAFRLNDWFVAILLNWTKQWHKSNLFCFVFLFRSFAECIYYFFLFIFQVEVWFFVFVFELDFGLVISCI